METNRPGIGIHSRRSRNLEDDHRKTLSSTIRGSLNLITLIIHSPYIFNLWNIIYSSLLLFETSQGPYTDS